MIEVKAPNPTNESLEHYLKHMRVFLGGSIEMGKAENWQTRLVKDFENYDIEFWNPRRDDWDSSWIQDPSPGTQFRVQVDWELEKQENADVVVYYLAPGTISPISLLEIGLFAPQHESIVCVPDGFERKGNVAIVCERYGINMVESYEDLVSEIKKYYEER